MANLDLDIAAPEQIAPILRTAAGRYRESVSELSAAWQDQQAGKIWGKLAIILERAADSCERVCNKEFGPR